MVQSSRVVRVENSREPSVVRPESSCTITHLAMSSAPDMIPPAGLVLSLRNGAMARTVPSIRAWVPAMLPGRSEEHTSELQSLAYLVCRLLLEKKKNAYTH